MEKLKIDENTYDLRNVPNEDLLSVYRKLRKESLNNGFKIRIKLKRKKK